MARYPISVNIKKTPLKMPAPKAAKPVAAKPAGPTPAQTRATLGRAERIQREEAGESMLMKRKPDVVRTTTNYRPTPTKKK
jgi:hypothetical protein